MKKLISFATTVTLLFALVALFAINSTALFTLPDLNGINSFTAVKDDGSHNFNFKDSGGAWVNIMNPWGDSAYIMIEPGDGFVQSMIVTFEISGYDGGDEGYRVMPGLAINSFTPSVWALGNERTDTTSWEEIFGEEYFYFIDGDGVYQMIVSFRAAMDWQESQNEDLRKDYVESIDVIELGIFYPEEDVTTMKVTILDLEETGSVYAFEDIQRQLGSAAFFADSVENLPVLPEPIPWAPPVDEDDGAEEASATEEAAPAPDADEAATGEEADEATPDAPDAAPTGATTNNDSDSADGAFPIVIVIVGGVLVVIVVVALIIKGKKK
ncbi:MAG: hypothetical protein FWD48_03145 [Oscillospiraceae bacterium]|nr:hypothetical protein [Oscillospiraceae bacterium]